MLNRYRGLFARTDRCTHQRLFEHTRYPVDVARREVPGRGGDDLVVQQAPLAHRHPVAQAAAGGFHEPGTFALPGRCSAEAEWFARAYGCDPALHLGKKTRRSQQPRDHSIAHIAPAAGNQIADQGMTID